MERIKLILGHITFLDKELDGVHKAIVHRVDKTIFFNTVEAAEENGEISLNNFESYLVPSSYTGEIEYLNN